MKRSETDIEKILSSFDGISGAKARPFMHTRVLARLKEENSFWGRATGFVTRPAIAFTCLSAILITNIYTMVKTGADGQETPAAVTTPTAVSDVLQNDNYILAVSDIN